MLLIVIECGNELTHEKGAFDTVEKQPTIAIAADRYSDVRCIATICKLNSRDLFIHIYLKFEKKNNETSEVHPKLAKAPLKQARSF